MEGKDKYRMQLYLDEARYLFLKERVAKYNTSMREVVRALIDKEMGGTDAVTESDLLFRIAATAVTTGRVDGPSDHDATSRGRGLPDLTAGGRLWKTEVALMIPSVKWLLVDTSAFITLYSVDDRYHQAARSLFTPEQYGTLRFR